MIGLDNPMYPKGCPDLQMDPANVRSYTLSDQSCVTQFLKKKMPIKQYRESQFLGNRKTLMNANNKWKSLTHGAKRTEKKTSIFFPLHFI